MKTTRILSLLMAVVMLIGMIPGMVFAADEAIQIASAEDFPTEIAEGAEYELSADIVLSAGQQIETLAGLLDGKGYTVTLADKPLANNVSGTIQNLGIKGNGTLTIGANSASIAVTLSGTMQNCYSLVDLTVSGVDDSAGLVGTLSNGKIYNCYYAGKNATYGGGLVAYAEGGEISNTYYTNGMMGPVSVGTNKVTKTNVEKMADMTGIAAVEALNTEINDTGFIWAQDTENINGGYPVLTEATGEITVNKSALEAKIAEADELNEAKYTEDTWSALSKALSDARTVYESETATQSDVNSALGALESAISGLEIKKPTEPVSQNDYKEVKHITKQSELEAIGAGKADTYYILDNDITLDGWYMSFDTFSGVFDGNGNTITFNGDYTGLFKNIGSNGVVQNVHFAGALKASAEYGACAQEIHGAVVNCYSEISGAKASGFAKRLNNGIISNCYSVSKDVAGVIIEQTETPNGASYTGTLKNVYWDSELTQPIDLSKLTLSGEVKGLKASAMKSMDFVDILNANKGTYGTAWGQNSNGYPYFGENLEYTPEEEGKVVLPENKTAIAFTSERTQTTTVIENQELKIDVNSAVNKIAGLFSLPEYELQEDESIEWSTEQQSPEGVASVGSSEPYLSIEKEGVLVVKATLIKADSSREVLACTKVIIGIKKIEDIKLYLADYDDLENGTEILDGKASVSGSADIRILIKVLYSGELAYKTVSSENFTITLSDPDNAVKHTENTNTMRFKKPGTASVTVTYTNDATVTESVEITSVYVPVTSITPGISGTVVLHGRNGNSSSGENFLPDYANVSVEPANASYADAYKITSSDASVGEYIESMIHGYVPHKAGKVTYTASVNDNGNEISGTSEVIYVYKNPLKSVTAENSEITVSAGESVPSGLVFEGTLTDGHEITETGMSWSFSEEGIVSVSRGNGFWKNDETAPDKGNYFLSSDYTIKALAEGTVTVTGTPVDTTGGAQPVTFTVTVGGSEAEAPDVYDIISSGIRTSELYIQNQLADLHKDGGVTYGFEWYITAMLRAGKAIDAEILDEYYESVLAEAAKWDSDVKPTDVTRTALALAAMGKDITDVGGVNLAELIVNSDRLSDGSNELAYALIALDVAKAEIPDSAKWSREKIVDEILKFKAKDGGFGLADNSSSEVDMTAICVQALAPYGDDSDVRSAIDGAVEYLKKSISADYNYANNTNSTAQALLALSILKIDVTDKDNGFGGDYHNIITALYGFRNGEGNGFTYNDKVNSMATVQVIQAFDAYRKAHREDILYWDFDTKGKEYNDTTSGGGSGEDGSDSSATVYVTIASEGMVVQDKNEDYLAQAPVKVEDIDKNGILTVDEALYAAHEKYYPGGAAEGYSSFASSYGLSLARLWGKGTPGTNATAGYWLNNVSCLSLGDKVKDGDYLTAFNYYDAIGWSDAYSYFDKNEVSFKKGASVSLTLNSVGYDSNWNTVASPYQGAKVVVLGDDEKLTTDKNGQVKISISKAGTYYVMAYAENGSIVPAVCKIVVTSSAGGGTGSDKITVYIRVADPKGKTYLKKTSYSVEKGTSAYDLLEMTGLDVETTKSIDGVYVKGIEGLSEFDKGPQSGWVYRVNGKLPDCSAELYTLAKGAYVEWLYTRNNGKDVESGKTSSSSGGGGGSGVSSSSSSNVTSDKEEEKTPQSIFEDVNPDDWFYDSVNYVYENKLMNGTGDGFEPDSAMTRAMLVTVLFRMENPENIESEADFADVPDGEWYTDAVNWAAANGIVNGISDTEFAPNDNVTREQMAAIFYRYAQHKEYDTKNKADLSGFADSKEISEWAEDAVMWAKAEGLINGTSETTISPMETATRAQVATILMRFCKNTEK